MIVCFHCPPKIKAFLDRLVREEGYEDISQAIVSAVENLEVLTEQIGGQLSIVLDEPPLEEAGGVQSTMSPNESSLTLTSSVSKKDTTQIPEIFAMPSVSHHDHWSENEVRDRFSDRPIPPKFWLFGMYNKLLPLKASCRAIANTIIHEYPKGIPITQIPVLSDRIAAQAQRMSRMLNQHDKTYRLNRDSSISLGFPSTKKDEKSKQRYANQFVARYSSGSGLSGFPYQYGLFVLDESDLPLLNLTQAGWGFASIANPVLDQSQEYPAQKLSSDECMFLRGHIAKYVPGEWWLFRQVLQIVSDTNKTASQIDAELATLFDPALTVEPSLSTARSGVISRMTDLGMLSKTRDGLVLSYIAADQVDG